MSKILGRDDLLSGNHLKKDLVEVPELDGSMYVRELTTSQLISFNERVREYKQGGASEVTFEVSVRLMGLIVSLSACDENGNLLFTENDVANLMNNKIPVLERLSAKALSLSQMDIKFDEVTNNLKKVTTSSSSSSVKSFTKRKRK